MNDVTTPGGVRIGELSRRVGVSEHLLRAWESRYGLLSPRRSSGGYRLYSPTDEWRVRRMRHHLDRGLSAAQAAEVVLTETAPEITAAVQPADTASAPAGRFATELRTALDAYDEPAAQAVFDRMLAELSLPAMLRDVVLPYLRELGERWERGEITVSQEHYASHVVRGRLAGLSRGWGTGAGRRALLACPSGERHDLPLMMFGIVLNRNGWRVDYFGADTPVDDIIAAADRTAPDLVVLAATVPDHFDAIRDRLATLGSRTPLTLAGAGAGAALAEEVGARILGGDPVTAAEAASAGR